MPAYNRASYVGEAIESVLHQTHRELIVVDDGSSDNTAEVVAGFKDNRVKYIYQTNSGMTPDRLWSERPDYVVILPWILQAEIVSQIGGIRDWGGRFIVPIPHPQVI